MTDEANETAAEIPEQELSLEDELSNAFDESIAEDAEQVSEDDNQEEASTEGIEDEPDEDAVETDETDDEQVEDEDELTAPENWSKKDQEMFEGQLQPW